METSKENIEFCFNKWKEFLNSGDTNAIASIDADLRNYINSTHDRLKENWDLDEASKFIHIFENYILPQMGIENDGRLPDYTEFIKISPKLFAELSSPDAVCIQDKEIDDVLMTYGQVIRGALLKNITHTCKTFSKWGDDFNQSETFTMYLDISKLTILEADRLELIFHDKDAVKKMFDEILIATFFGDIAKQWETHFSLESIYDVTTTHEAGLPYLKVVVKGNLFYSYGFIKKYLELAEQSE
jgi:hypothetical protein